MRLVSFFFFFFFQAEDGIRDKLVTGVQTCALTISAGIGRSARGDVADLAERRRGRARRFSFTVPQLAAACVALVLLSGAAVWRLPAPAAPPPGARGSAPPPPPAPRVATRGPRHGAPRRQPQRPLPD